MPKVTNEDLRTEMRNSFQEVREDIKELHKKFDYVMPVLATHAAEIDNNKRAISDLNSRGWAVILVFISALIGVLVAIKVKLI